jgi:hypothetical protein
VISVSGEVRSAAWNRRRQLPRPALFQYRERHPFDQVHGFAEVDAHRNVSRVVDPGGSRRIEGAEDRAGQQPRLQIRRGNAELLGVLLRDRGADAVLVLADPVAELGHRIHRLVLNILPLG